VYNLLQSKPLLGEQKTMISIYLDGLMKPRRIAESEGKWWSQGVTEFGR
jgi:hypothetical protein